MMIVAKLDGRLVEVKRVAHTVGFSEAPCWVMICTDFEQPERKKQHFKWIPASTRFDWIRNFAFPEVEAA